jgi:hypothetical protein
VLAQLSISPNASPTINTGGWVYGMVVLLVALGILVAILIVFGYMRFAPRFQREEGEQSVRAPRLQPGRDVRRPVKITGAPIVAPPPIPTATVAAAAPQAAAAPAPAPAAAPATAATTASAPPAEAPAAAPATPSETAPAPAAAPAAPTAAPVAAAPVSAPAPAEHKEVALDQETYEKTLAELLAKGTDRRVAEGQAKRTALIAARKKAGG